MRMIYGVAYAFWLLFLSSATVAPAQTFTTPPFGYTLFCAKYKTNCASSGPASIAQTAKLMADLKLINARVNAAITPTPDAYESWDLYPKLGDCDDFVMTKRDVLIKMGYPVSALRHDEARCPDQDGLPCVGVPALRGRDRLPRATPRLGCIHRQGRSCSRQPEADNRAFAGLRLHPGQAQHRKS
ncbi:putative transglutaminase-like cysteine peptidase [Rhizobium phage P11VFA]|nr:putative transglutaminase-like cysteine peptidase [Rhizobium phage P11VFA]